MIKAGLVSTFALWVFALSAFAQPANLAGIKASAKDGAKTVKGSSPYAGAIVSIKANGVPEEDCSDSTKCLSANDGSFAIPLRDALKENQQVEVTVAGAAKPFVFVVAAADKPQTVSFGITQPHEGDKTVQGTVDDPSGAIDAIEVRILDDKSPTQSPVAATYDVTGHKFSASVTPLAEGQTIHIHAFKAKTEVSDLEGATVVVNSAGYDWGRVRAEFSLASEWVRKDGSFGTPDVFAALKIDYNWYSRNKAERKSCFASGETDAYVRANVDNSEQGKAVRAKLKVKGEKPAANDDKSAEDKQEYRKAVADYCDPPATFLINTFADVRLTNIPSTTGTAMTGTAMTGTAMTGTSGVTAKATSATTTTGTLQLNQFQGVYMEMGAYAPIIPKFAQWRYDARDNALFIAPVARAGVQGFANAMATPGPDVFKFWSAGLRLGHFAMPTRPRSEAPEMLSYLDLTCGKWENFQLPNKTSLARLDATGRFKVPKTPFYVGGEANLGRGNKDLRITIGTRLDLGSILGKLVPSL